MSSFHTLPEHPWDTLDRLIGQAMLVYIENRLPGWLWGGRGYKGEARRTLLLLLCLTSSRVSLATARSVPHT